MTDLLPQFGNLALTIAAFVVALSVIVAIHELGHYLVGRWTGIRAEVFSVGFGPVLASRTDRHGTRWQLAALPFGGFVKFWGDANAASVGGDDAALTEEQRRHTMLGAPLWARALTVAAGPAANFVLAALIFSALFMAEGRPAEPLTIARFTQLPESYASDLQVGDEVLSVAGVPVTATTLSAVEDADLPVVPRVPYEIRRDSETLTVDGPWPFPPAIGIVTPRSAAQDAGIHTGDVVLTVDDEPIFAFQQLSEVVGASEGRTLALTIWRDGETVEVDVAPRKMDVPDDEGNFESRWRLGVPAAPLFEVRTEAPGLLDALWSAVQSVGYVITTTLSALVHLLSGAISTCNLSGPVGIAQVMGSGAEEGLVEFISRIGLLSVAVGLMNLFPIPVLDGGHLVFHAYEALTGRPPGDRALRALMGVGLALILSLTLFGILNDLVLCP